MVKNRGQVAMEFLMTYGWAIIIILVAVGALWMLGVFSPSVSTNCTIDPPFSCKDAIIGTKGVSFKLALGSDATGKVNKVEVNGELCDLTDNEIKSNQVLSISCNGLDLEDDESVSVSIDASYKRPGKFTKPVSGAIMGTAKTGEEKYIEKFEKLNLCNSAHGLGFDGTYFYVSCNGLVTQTDDQFQVVKSIPDIKVGSDTYIFTGVTYDKKNNVYWGVDWYNNPSAKKITKFVDNSFSTTPVPQQWNIAGNPIGITSDGNYLYTNHRDGFIKRHKVSDPTGWILDAPGDKINMNQLAGFEWGGQGITYLNGYLYAGTTACCRTPAGQHPGRIYVIDISDWDNPKIVDKDGWGAQDLNDIYGLTNDGEYLYATQASTTGPIVKYSIPAQW